MVREDSPDKQEWVDSKSFRLWSESLVAYSKKHTNAWCRIILRKDGSVKIFSSMTEKEQREVYRRLNENIHSINETINNPVREIQEKVKLDISEIKAAINKVIENALPNAKALRIRDRTENLISRTSFWIPRKYREAIVGDILEDCHELRALGKSEWRIRIQIIWQLAIALILLRPTALMDAFKRIRSTK